MAIGKGADITGSPAHLTQDAFERIIDSNPEPISIWGISMDDRFFNAFMNDLSGLFQFL
jgi:hypothetical protein